MAFIPEQTTILIIDDTPNNLHLLSQILRAAGYQVRAARSGALALSSVAAAPPDLILLDIMMPEMDGFEVCTRLKEDERTREIPVIFLSALDDVENKVRSFAAGGVDYVTKPFQVREVLARVHTHLTIRHLQQNLNAQIAELDAFAHTVAHDLKSPLTTIIGFADLLRNGYESLPREEALHLLDRLESGGRKAANIVDELLLLAGVGRQQVVPEPLAMRMIVTQALERLQHLIVEHQAEVVLADEWPIALGYAPWIEEVWANYISNAVKYGGRPPRVQVGGTVETAGRVRFWVRDNGVGLSAVEQASLFTEFTRLEQRAAVSGHGLGLSIVQRIMTKLGGTVGVHSEVGVGSEFYFVLPVVLA